MPALVEVEIATAHYYRPPELPHPRRGSSIHRRGRGRAPTSCAATSRCTSRSRATTRTSGSATPRTRWSGASRAYPPDARAAWSELWELVAQLRGRDEHRFSANVLGRALEACDSLLEGGWRELRDELRARRPFAADATVAIRRG